MGNSDVEVQRVLKALEVSVSNTYIRRPVSSLGMRRGMVRHWNEADSPPEEEGAMVGTVLKWETQHYVH